MVVIILARSLMFGQAAAQEEPGTAGQGSPDQSVSSVGTVTVTAPLKIGGQRNQPPCAAAGQPASSAACAAVQLDAAAKRAEAAAQGQPQLVIPGTQSPAATVGVGTPAAAAQQPGTPYGKPPGYVPSPPPGVSAGAGPFARVRP